MSMVSSTIRSLIASVALGATPLCAPAHADQSLAIPRIGVLTSGATSFPEDYLRDGLRELGYIEGKNILIESRGLSAQTDEDLRSLVADWARLKVDLIVAFSTPTARAALQATKVPVVFISGDPVGTGLATSLARPGGQGTGVSMLNRELTGKRMELLKQVAPGIRRIVFLMNSANPLDARMLEEAQKAARTLSVELVTSGARDADELGVALHLMHPSTADGLLVSNDLLFLANKAKITQAARKAKVPAIFPYKEYHDDGALMSYGPSVREANRKIAVYVDKILKGAKPSALPIEQISKYELIIDLRVARGMGIHVPQELLLRADEVIR